jgi:hypothetical protein
MDNIIVAFLAQLATRSPTLLLFATGLVLAIAFWSRYPRPCMLVFLAMSLALIVTVCSAFVFLYLPRAMNEFGWDHLQLSLMFTVVGVITNVFHAGALGLLLAAVFVDRRPLPPRLQHPVDEREATRFPGTDTRIQG